MADQKSCILKVMKRDPNPNRDEHPFGQESHIRGCTIVQDVTCNGWRNAVSSHPSLLRLCLLLRHIFEAPISHESSTHLLSLLPLALRQSFTLACTQAHRFYDQRLSKTIFVVHSFVTTGATIDFVLLDIIGTMSLFSEHLCIRCDDLSFIGLWDQLFPVSAGRL